MESCCMPAFRFIGKHASNILQNRNGSENRCSVQSPNCPPTSSMGVHDHEDDSRVSGCPLVLDVLVHMFRYLPLSDRKNVKQTCRLWNEACAAASVTENDKLVFRPNCSILEIAHLLRNMSFKRIYIEFQNQLVHRLPADVWKTCGRKVSGLHFYHCYYLNQQCLKVAIEYCVNLCDINVYKSGSPLDCEMLDYFIENKMKREKLSTFAVTYPYDEFIDHELMRRIFVVFPRIQNFTTGNATVRSIPNFSGETLPSHSVTELKNLVYLHHDYSDGVHWLQAPMIPVFNLKLKKFETTLNSETSCIISLKETLFKFFNQQEQLEIINLRIVPDLKSSPPSNEWTSFIAELTFLILQRCPKLREFRLADLYNVYLTTADIVNFFENIAELKSLVIDRNCFRVPNPSTPLARLALDTLRAESDGHGTGELKACILRRCSLKHLRIGKLSDGIFQEILKTQPNLRTLILDDIQNLTTLSGRNHHYGARTGHGLSIRQLRRLEYLGINEQFYYKLTDKAADEFQLPALKHLKLNLHAYSMLEKLSRIALKIPAVEVLELNTLVLSKWTEIIILCSRLKNLRRLSIYLVERPERKDLMKLFQTCPNLRYVSQICLDEINFLNPFTGRIRTKGPISYVKFPKAEDIFDG